MNSIKHLGKKLCQFSSLFQKIESEKILPKSFYEAAITQISKQEKGISGKQNYKSVSFLNMEVKILNEILRSCIQRCMKKIIHHGRVGFILSV